MEQHHFGTPSRPGYHNSQWACLMKEVGLIPSATGKPGGKETGQQISHYIEPAGRFSASCAELIDERGFTLPYVELWDESEREMRAKKASSKTKYTCPSCRVNAWAKPGTRLLCGRCREASSAIEMIG